MKRYVLLMCIFIQSFSGPLTQTGRSRRAHGVFTSDFVWLAVDCGSRGCVCRVPAHTHRVRPVHAQSSQAALHPAACSRLPRPRRFACPTGGVIAPHLAADSSLLSAVIMLEYRLNELADKFIRRRQIACYAILPAEAGLVDRCIAVALP